MVNYMWPYIDILTVSNEGTGRLFAAVGRFRFVTVIGRCRHRLTFAFGPNSDLAYGLE